MTSQIRRRRLIAAAIVVGAIVILVGLVATRPRAERRKPVVPPTTVTVETVNAEQPPVLVTGWGTVQPKRSVNLVPQVSGRVVAVSPNLQAGAFFAAGEVLVEIEDTDYMLGVQQALSQVAQADYSLATAQEEARVAREEWKRTRSDAGNGSSLNDAEPNALVFREPQLKQAEVGLQAAKAALAQAELSLSRCRLTAPFAGRVINETADPGDYVMAGNVLGRIDDTSVAEITVNLPHADMAWVPEPGAGEAAVRGDYAGQERRWAGRLARLGGAIDEISRTVPVVVEVDAPYSATSVPLMAGMFVAVDFRSAPPAGTVTIPRRGLRPGNQVWVLDEDDRLRIRNVTALHAGESDVVLSEGLQAGERLITSNLQYVVDGMQLRTADSPAPRPETDGGGERR